MRPSLLAILPFIAERQVIADLAAREGWLLRLTESMPSGNTGRPGVILYDRDTPGLEWRGALEQLTAIAGQSCIILVSTVTDQYLWDEVVQRGGYDVLTKPLAAEAVIHMVGLAWSFYKAGLATK